MCACGRASCPSCGLSLSNIAASPQSTATPATYTDTERNYLLTVWGDGTHELALRDEHRRWLSPVRLNPEPVETLAEVPC
jgi:hypothetical protein